MKRQQCGAIVTINTQASRKPFAGEAGYAVSKGALVVAAKYPARELGVHGIRANNIHMGWMWVCRRRPISGRPRPSME